MVFMFIPVFNINLCQFLIPNYQQILRIFFFRSFGKIKTSGYYSFLINNYYLVVGDGVFGDRSFVGFLLHLILHNTHLN